VGARELFAFACCPPTVLVACKRPWEEIIDSNAIQPGQDFHSVGPALPAEMLKAPYRPRVAGKMAFFFGPVAGAIVSVINLRRFGYPVKARRVLLWTLLAAVVLAVVLVLTPDLLGRAIGLAADIAFFKVYASIQEKEFADWQSANPGIEPQNGWKALGWGVAGLVLFIVIIILVELALSMIFPSVLD